MGPHDLPDAPEVDLPGAPVRVDCGHLTPVSAPSTSSITGSVPASAGRRVDGRRSENALGVPSPPADATTMTHDQLLTMSGLPGADIGAHTLTHVQLRGQPAGIKRREIVGSVEALRSLTGRPVTSFAYPFGSPRAVDREAQRLVREAECTLAGRTNPPWRRSNQPLPLAADRGRGLAGDVFAERIEAALKN